MRIDMYQFFFLHRALEYLHQITKDLEFPDKVCRPEQLSSSAKKTKKSVAAKRCKRKASKRDQNDDSDFDPDDHEEAESEVDADEVYEVAQSCLPQTKVGSLFSCLCLCILQVCF